MSYNFNNPKLFILGAGCWGSTLATIYAQKGYCVYLWEPDEKQAQKLAMNRQLEFFKFVTIPKTVIIGSELTKLLDYDIILLVTPSKYVKETLWKIFKIPDFEKIKKNKIIISCVKGFATEQMLRPSQLITEILKVNQQNIFVFSGPSHAEEVAQKKPTAITLAGKNIKLLPILQQILSTKFLRVYIHTDIVGVELGGILKNVYAIACGICDGAQLGNNAKAAIITRSMKELVLVGKMLGGEEKTFFGLSGLGDLLTTSYSPYSRNRTFGELVVVKKDITTAKRKIKSVIEGIRTTKFLHKIASKFKLDLPIAEEVYKIIYKNKSIESAIKTLFSRKLQFEFYNYLK